MTTNFFRTTEIGRRTALLGLGAGLLAANGARAEAVDPWPSLADEIFGGRPIADGSAILAADAPYRAEDAAVVPVGLRWVMPAGDARTVRRVTLVIDGNPAPLAAIFGIGAESGIDRIATRVRIDDYTNIHAVAELSDGALVGVARYVKAAGGCSAPAVTESADAIPLGTMRLRTFAAAPGTAAAMREAQVMVRHPNYSGMQMDQLTRLYIPAHFLQSLTLTRGGSELLTVTGGISVAQNPSFRFAYRTGAEREIHAEAIDNEGMRFAGNFSTEPSAT